MRVTTRTVEHKTYHCSFCDYQDEDEQDVRQHEAGLHHMKEYRLLGREGHGQEEFFRFESEASFWEYVGGKNLFAYDWAWKGPGWYGLLDGLGQRPELVSAQEVLDRLRAELAAQREMVAAVGRCWPGPRPRRRKDREDLHAGEDHHRLPFRVRGVPLRDGEPL